jgi:hypothetical protein
MLNTDLLYLKIWKRVPFLEIEPRYLFLQPVAYCNLIDGYPINFLIGSNNGVTDTAARRERLLPDHSAASGLLASRQLNAFLVLISAASEIWHARSITRWSSLSAKYI